MRVMLIVYCAIFLVLAEVGDDANALELGKEGVCVARISSMQTRRKSYVVTVMRYGRRRLMKKFRIESYLTWTNHTICCQGWQHDSRLDTCTPVCSTGCAGGRCIAPSICHCEPPLYLDPTRRNACLAPTCEPPCVNSVCTLNNICLCHENTRRYNKTHCSPCGEDYTINPDLSCSPHCDQECTNGKCTAPNTCSCLHGYRLDGLTCVPICDKCVNSTCAAPGLCDCFEGYTAVDNTTCVPKCDNCDNGVCVAPGVCECSVGYTENNGTCEPVCEFCENGVCSAPDVCTCDDGYVMKEPGVCAKPCRPECNGTCGHDGLCSAGVCNTIVLAPFYAKNLPTPQSLCVNHYIFIMTSCQEHRWAASYQFYP